MAKFSFPCGCSFDSLDIDHLRLDCPATWDLICAGNTVGVFQLENPLGQTWARRTQPRNIEELADLISLLRPGCLESGMSDKYVKIKRGDIEADYIHESLKPIFEKTNGVLVFQEQALQVAKDIAGFSLSEADSLRKSMGKKLPEEMAKVKVKFLEGCENNHLKKEVADEIFSWIEKSQRYSFNKCISKDTHIAGYEGSVEHVYNNWPNYVNSTALSRDIHNKIVPNKIAKIVKNGYRQVYKIVVDYSYFIKVTCDHKFPTPKGELRCDQLSVTDQLYCVDDAQIVMKNITSISESHIDMTYDVTMEHEPRNFITDGGIVTCNSHAVAYALNGYICAYLKQHFPLQFFCAYLEYAKDKMKPHEEINKLVVNAKSMGLTIRGPSLPKGNSSFIIDQNSIRFGLGHIKNVGEKSFAKIQQAIYDAEQSLSKKLADITWPEWLSNISTKINSKSVEFLIYSGAMDYIGLSRKKMIYEFQKFQSLTDKEREFILHHCGNNTLAGCIIGCSTPKNEGGGAANRNRAAYLRELGESLGSPPYALADSSSSIAQNELVSLGLGLTEHAISDFDTYNILHSCSDFNNIQDSLIIGVTIDEVRSHLTKTGKNKGSEMAFMKVSDETGSINNVVVFPETWAEYRYLLIETNKVCLYGEKSKKNDGLIVKKVSQLSLQTV